MVLVKGRHLDQQNKIEGPETNPQKHSQLIFDKEQRPRNGENTVFSTNAAATTEHLHGKNESRHRPYTHKLLKMKHKPKCQCKTIKIPENDRGENLDDLGYGNDF